MQALFGMGCFWGAEWRFWQLDGVNATAVGYAGGQDDKPDYKAVCSGQTGHAEVVWLEYDPKRISYAMLLKQFWVAHDPTQGMRQGNDIGTQYRSVIFTYDQDQQRAAEHSRITYQQVLTAAGFGTITTEILPAPTFFPAEEYHQRYLQKNPAGYCGLGGTGVAYPER